MKRFGAWLRGEFGNVAIAVSLAAFLCIVLPVQTYLANASLFVFTPGRMALELAILFVGMAAAVWLLLATVGRFLGGFLQAVFVAALVCVYRRRKRDEYVYSSSSQAGGRRVGHPQHDL